MSGFGWLVVVLLSLALFAKIGLILRRIYLARTAREITPLFEDALADLESHTEYLSHSLFQEWKHRQHSALEAIKRFDPKMRDALPSDEGERFSSLFNRFASADYEVKEYNKRFIERRLVEDGAHFDLVEAYPLTERQREAIVTEEDTTIVVAGAGTGKTSVIVGKVDYLLRHKLAKPSEMLVMAYNNAAAEELRQRMTRLGVSEDITVKTFHSFGYSVLGDAEGTRDMISPLAEDSVLRHSFFKDTMRALMTSAEYKHAIGLLFTDLLDEKKVESESTESAQRTALEIALCRAIGLRCLEGSKLKSRQEVKIANWLTLSGIAWEYERPYEVDQSTAEHANYQPDFYLPDHGVYIEHFGIDRDGGTAPGVDQRHYAQQMDWKRDIHREHGTTLVETYSYDDQDGYLTRRLEAKLAKLGIEPRELTKQELDLLISKTNKEFGKFYRTIEQFLNLYRGSVMTWDEVAASAQSDRDKSFLQVMREIVRAYEARLKDEGRIDFDDMITRARSAIQDGKVHLPFTHIIIDEFQDITHNRFGLVQDIRNRVKNGRVFAVGDDWQSIYRFNGSDVSITTRLPDFAGVVARVDLDQTFRYPQELLDASAKFVTKNPSQLKKKIESKVSRSASKPIQVVTAESDTSSDAAIWQVLDGIRRGKQGEDRLTVYVLARYNNSLPRSLSQLQREFADSRIAVNAMTVHKSKGLEADYVIILDLSDGGFPSGVSDDPVMRMVLAEGDDFPFAEERRLFYVAMTRARKGVYMVAPSSRASIFLEEDLMNEEYESWVKVSGALGSRHTCPVCGGRTIRKIDGRYGEFWACSNFPLCDGKLATCTACNQGVLVPNGDSTVCDNCHAVNLSCPRCETGTLVERKGRYGPFLACTNWNGGRGCNYTRNVAVEASESRLY